MTDFKRKLHAVAGVLVGVCIVQACSREVPPEESCNFVQNFYSQRVSWENNLPVPLYVDASVPNDYVAAIQSAVDQWNTKGLAKMNKKYFQIRSGNPGGSAPGRDGYSKIFVMNTWESNKSNEQGRTTVFWTGTRIYEADIRINEKNFDFYLGEQTDRNKVHLESLMVHELGHVLGLAHKDEINSVMQTHLANGTLRDQPSSADMSSLSCEYH